MLTRTRAAALVLAGLALSACGNIHPGDAAVVDDRSISMRTLDKAAVAYCELTARAAAAQGASEPDNADLRRQAVTTLVSLEVGRRLAEAEGLTPPAASYELTSKQRKEIAKAFPGSDVDEIAQAIEDSQELSAISLALGEKASGQKSTAANQAQVAEAGQAAITKAFKQHDVEFSPRFGLADSGEPVSATGSLSVAPADLGESDDTRPATQRCT